MAASVKGEGRKSASSAAPDSWRSCKAIAASSMGALLGSTATAVVGAAPLLVLAAAAAAVWVATLSSLSAMPRVAGAVAVAVDGVVLFARGRKTGKATNCIASECLAAVLLPLLLVVALPRASPDAASCARRAHTASPKEPGSHATRA